MAKHICSNISCFKLAGITFSMQWVKAHCTPQHVAAGILSCRDFLGNWAADLLAKRGAEQHRLAQSQREASTKLHEHVVQVLRRAFRVHCHMCACREWDDDQTRTGASAPNPMELEVIQHRIERHDDKVYCARCRKWPLKLLLLNGSWLRPASPLYRRMRAQPNCTDRMYYGDLLACMVQCVRALCPTAGQRHG